MASITASMTDSVRSWLRVSPSDSDPSPSCRVLGRMRPVPRDLPGHIARGEPLRHAPLPVLLATRPCLRATRYPGPPRAARSRGSDASSASAKRADLLNSLCAMARPSVRGEGASLRSNEAS